MNKDILIKTATALFAAHGVKAVSMERIATEAGVLEKDAEAEFNDVEQLLEQCLIREIETIDAAVSDAVSQAQSSMERLIYTVSVIFARLSVFCPAFFSDLKGYASARKQSAYFSEKFHNRCVEYLIECEADEFIVSDMDMKSTALFCIEQMNSMQRKYQTKMIRIFLESISTEKGRREIKRIEKLKLV